MVFSGKLNPNYRGGKSKCIDCNILLSARYNKPTRCRPCYRAFAVGRNATNWKGGKGFPNCVNCDAKTGDAYSILCRVCYRGKLSPCWRGGVATIQSLVRNMPANKQWTKQCMYRDNYQCTECGVASTGNNLVVHHLKQFAQILKENGITSVKEAERCTELWDTDNGQTLCKSCHKLTETFNKKIS